MYYQDLTLCSYHPGPCSYESWQSPLLSIGWLEIRHTFSTGNCPNDLIEKIILLRKQSRTTFPMHAFRGLHCCSLCSNKTILENSEANIFIPSKDKIYICPGRIDHYIKEHNYLPPTEFLEALKACPDINTPDYEEKLTKANKENEPPLY